MKEYVWSVPVRGWIENNGLSMFEKGNNEYVFVNIEPLTVDNKATIKLTFFPEFQGSAIITIILVALNIIFLIAFIIFKKCFKKKKDLK